MPADNRLFQTEQERAFAGLLTDVLDKVDGRFSDLDRKQQEKFTQAAREIERLSDDVERVRAGYRERFDAIAEQYASGRMSRSAFASVEQARSVGVQIAAALGAPWAAEALKGDMRRAAIQSQPGASGGFLMPDSLLGAIISNVEKYGVYPRDANQFEWSGEAVSRVTREGGFTVYYPNYGIVPNESAPAFGFKRVELPKYVTYVAVDRTMLRDTWAASLADYVTQEIAHAMSLAVDRNAFVGDGSPTYARTVGLFNAAGGADVTAETGHNTFAEVIDQSTEYLSRLIGNLPDSADDGDCKFYLHRSIFWRYLGLRDSQNRPVADILTKGDRPQRVLMGYPAEFVQVGPRLADSAASKALLLLGNLRRGADYYYNSAAGSFMQSDHVKMLHGQVVMYAEMLHGIGVADATMYGRLLTAAA